MTKLEERLEEAYDDLDDVDRQYDEVTQINRKRINYLIRKRQLVCDRIGSLKEEVKLDEENTFEERKESEGFSWIARIGNIAKPASNNYFVR